MYITTHGLPLYRLSLTSVPALPAVTSVVVTGATGYVFDWAAHTDGLLYGGDSSHGQLAVLDPQSGVRVDYTVPGLESGFGFGAAWFGPSGQLFLYRNSGELLEIDVVGRTLIRTYDGPGSSHNDGARCAPAP